MPNRFLLNALASSFLRGGVNPRDVAANGGRTLGRRWRWLQPLAERYVGSIAGRLRPRHREVVRFIAEDDGFRRAWAKYKREIAVHEWLAEPERMHAPANAWGLPGIETPGDLARWLELTSPELDWFADLKGLGYKNPAARLRHYHYRVLAKRFGAVRLIESPKLRLKAIQRRILVEILSRVPLHEAVHGFVKGRSVKTFASPHAGKRVILRLDLCDFFPSFSGARIQAFFRTIGYPETVADLLGGICTNAAPLDVWRSEKIAPDLLILARGLYARPHLPQGAPSSPALANACAFRIDRRLAGLAKASGATYTRYADDLAFSGGAAFDRSVERFATHVAAIAAEEGFRVNHRKTRIMRQGVRQHLAGVVANQRPNVIRGDYDRLKATLFNSVRLGPESQNREGHPDFRAHLLGRVSFVEMLNPARGRRLRAILDRIAWPSP